MTILPKIKEITSKVPTLRPLTAGVICALFGLLYIPAFMHGYFWLWVFPFIGVLALFIRAMIDAAIERVSQKGDKTVQAKAMRPELTKINLVAIPLVSLPFISALLLNHFGYIDRLYTGGADPALVEWLIDIWSKKSHLPHIMLKTEESSQYFITISNVCYSVLATFLLTFLCWKHFKKLYEVLLYQETPKYSPTKACAVINPGRFIIAIFFILVVVANELAKYVVPIHIAFIYLISINCVFFILVKDIISTSVEEKYRVLFPKQKDKK